MPTDEGDKIHGDKLEPQGDRPSDKSTTLPNDKLEIPSPREHSTDASVKIHGDKLEPLSEQD